MAGIYIHIPFCKQACSYCDFHFSTSLKYKDDIINGILQEIEIRSPKWQDLTFDTIYFGGGTPSIVDVSDLEKILQKLHQKFKIDSQAEITLEGNPDDFTVKKTKVFQQFGVNRLSIGIQSFHQEDLTKLNRSHNALQAEHAIKTAQDIGFSNITIDLIYGIPGLTDDKWVQNIQKVLEFKIPHISAYALTVEKKTALAYQISEGIIPPVSQTQSAAQFEILRKALVDNDFLHYEISNFGKVNYISKHNSNYWKNVPYIGLGPGAHSYDGTHRRWNIANNIKYLRNLNKNTFYEQETLYKKDIYNELLMTGLRTIWGVDLNKIALLGTEYTQYLQMQTQKYIQENKLYIADNHLIANYKDWFMIEGIISDLFWVQKCD